jgi:hypothetical protein
MGLGGDNDVDVLFRASQPLFTELKRKLVELNSHRATDIFYSLQQHLDELSKAKAAESPPRRSDLYL